MRYKITYTQTEERDAANDLALLRSRHPGSTIRRGENGERKILYLTTPPKRAQPAENRCGNGTGMV